MTQKISRARLLKFLWRRRKPLWFKTRKMLTEINNEMKTRFDIPDTKAAWYKTPMAFLITAFGWIWVEWAVQKGSKRLTLFFVNLIPHDELEHYDLKSIIKTQPSISSIECIVAATLTRAPETIEKIYEYVTGRRFHYYSNLLADHVVNENAYLSLTRWNHTPILERITHQYDPTFVCWVALLFNQTKLFDDTYLLCDHDKLVYMIEHQFYSTEYAYIEFPTDKKEASLDVLQKCQREKLMLCVGSQGDTKKRKI